MVYHKHWLGRRHHPVLWELFERQDFQPSSASAMEDFFFTFPIARLELA